MEHFKTTDRGVLFKSKEKKQEKSPDYSGKINVKGETFYLSGWKNTSKTGEQYLSLMISQKTEETISKTENVPF